MPPPSSSCSSGSDSEDRVFFSWSDASDAANSLTGEAHANDESPTRQADGLLFAAGGGGGGGGSSSSVLDGVRGGGLLEPTERIHRYIDQCIPPALMAHQRSHDGSLLVQLCAELEAFGSPNAWANHVPVTVFDEYAAGGEGGVTDIESMCPKDVFPQPGRRLDVLKAALYSCDTVPYSPHPSLAELRHAANSGSGGATVPWSTLSRHLSYLTARLHRMLSVSHGRVGAYALPPRLQASVVPLLYAWVTHWPLIEADARCWRGVVRCFNAACRSSSLDQAFPDANAKRAIGSTLTLPWQPLAALCLSVRDARNVKLPSWRSALAVVVKSLPSLCRRASSSFSSDAVDGLWSLVASHLAPTEDGAAALSLFVRLVPYRHLCEPSTAAVAMCGSAKEVPTLRTEGDGASQGPQKGASPSSGCLYAPPQLTPRAKQILHFLLVDTMTWAPPGGRPSPAVEGRSDKKSKKSKASSRSQKDEERWFYLTWERAVITFAGSLAHAHPGVVGMDAFAEPLFTLWLQALQLPVESSAGLLGTSAVASSVAATVPCLARNREQAAGSRAIRWSSASYVRLLNAFPDTVDSPLWRQLERWVHATSVLVRPGMPCTNGSPADRVCDCYRSLASEAARLCALKRKRTARTVQRSCDVTVVAESDGQTTPHPGDARITAATSQAPHHWSPATVERFVCLFLPHAVAAFQARARHAQGFLCALLRLSPSTVLPEFLKCVQTGLLSPTEVAAQRAASTRLLSCAVPTILAGTTAPLLPSSNTSSGATLLAFLRETLPSLLRFIDPSSLVSALPVLSLMAVATNYAAVEEVLGSVDEVTAFATDYASRVISLFAAHADLNNGRFQSAEVVVRAFLREMPPEALTVVTREVLREAQARDHGARMVGLVRMVAACAPADTWACAEKHWLRVLHDTSARDAEVQWAAPLLAACVSELGDRTLVRVHAAAIWRGVHMQLRFITSEKRRNAGAEVMRALMQALMRPQEGAKPHFHVSSGKQSSLLQQHEVEGDSYDAKVQGNRPQPRPPKVGTASEARVYVEWPSAEDVQVAADLFNMSLKDSVRVIEGVSSGANLNTAVAGTTATDSSNGDMSLYAQFFTAAAATHTAPPSGSAAAVCCESAVAVTRHSVLEGTLQWMRFLLVACEWMFMEPTPAVGTVDSRQTCGVPWWDMDPRVAWSPTSAPLYGVSCRPAYTRLNLFELLHRCVCLPMLREHVVVPLRQCGVELQEWFGTGISEEAPTLTDDSQAVALEMLALLQWLSSSVVRLQQQQRYSAASLSSHLRQSIGRQCPWTRRRLPLACWITRSMQLQVEAMVHGHLLPVTRRTFSDIVSVLQSLCLSPRRSVRSSAVYLLEHSRLFGSLDSGSRCILAGRVRAVATDIICQWQAGVPSPASEAALGKTTLPPEEPPLLPSTTPATAATEVSVAEQIEVDHSTTSITPVTVGGVPSATLRRHTLQGAMEGVQRLVMSLALSPKIFDAPSACIELLRFLVCLSEELHSAPSRELLSQLTKDVRSAKMFLVSGAICSPAFTEVVVQLAYQVAPTHPARAVLLLAYAHLVYWPSPRRWVSLRTLQCLTRLSLVSYVALRCVAVDLLHAASLAFTVREPTWTVCTMADARLVPASFLLSPEASKELLSEADQRMHQAAVAVVQDCLQRLTEVCPLMPYYTGTKGLVFPLSYITVPRCAASALGLQSVPRGGDTVPYHCGSVTGHCFMNAFAYMQPPNAATYRLQWTTMLLGDTGGGVAVSDVVGERESSLSANTATQQLSPRCWVLQLLALPVECPQVHSDTQVASPTTVVELLASLSQDPVASGASSAPPPAALLLLQWADDALQAWQHSRCQNLELRSGDRRCASSLETSNSGGFSQLTSAPGAADVPKADSIVHRGAREERVGDDGGKEASTGVEEDRMYQLFRSLAIVSSAVLRLTAPLQPVAAPSPAPNSFAAAELRAKAVRFFSDVVVGVCSYVAVPHCVAQRVLFVACTTLGESLSSEELWDVVCVVAGQLGSPAHAGPAAAAATGDVGSETVDMWSQRQERLLCFIDTLLGGVSPAVTCVILPRLVALVEMHARSLSFSSAGQVRRMAAVVVTRLMDFSTLQSSLRVEFGSCRASADALVVSLMQRANTIVSQARLPFVCAGDKCNDRLVKVDSSACADASSNVGEAASPAVLLRPTSQDVALLTFTALCLQSCKVVLFEAHACDMIRLLCCCFDMCFTEVHRLDGVVEAALVSLMALRMPKTLVHQLIEQLCNVCMGAVVYGTSRRAKAVCTRALRRLIFPNLHRIGRFSVMEQLSAASFAALMQCDSGTRADGSHLMAVLTKVSAEAQTRVLVQRLAEELRQLPRQTALATPPAAVCQQEGAPSSSGADAGLVSRRVALVQALGAVVLADPGTPSSYVPKVMVRLAACAREGNTECGRVAKRIFEEWWRTHREGWEAVYKSFFTPEQVDAMSDLLLAPRYYV
ncbi:hypothetical protein JKF63_06460 [Porcisia hertigi]|uniref:Proteasome activator complex subunit 4 C-terminal domain-containing protein n=1 Tax=Porcisia hertigi TaxID=2761500 RepID=A0A837AXS8_9TRYP|nr:hypothetical protein JKF63_06460 [Porcisia hertigi]